MAFDQPVDNLPPNLLELHFYGNRFNHPLDNLPDTLIDIKLNDFFNYSMENFPPNIQKITCHPDYKNVPERFKNRIVYDE